MSKTAKRWSFKTKIMVLMLAVGLLPVFFGAMVAVPLGKESRLKQRDLAIQTLTGQIESSILERHRVQRQWIQEKLNDEYRRLEEFAANPGLAVALQEFHTQMMAFGREFGADREQLQAIQTGLVGAFENSGKLGAGADGSLSAEELAATFGPSGLGLQFAFAHRDLDIPGDVSVLKQRADGAGYAASLARYTPFLKAAAENLGLKDIYLVHPESNRVVFSLGMGPEVALPLSEGPLAASALAQFHTAAVGQAPGSLAFGAPASFALAGGTTVAWLGCSIPTDEGSGSILLQFEPSLFDGMVTTAQQSDEFMILDASGVPVSATAGIPAEFQPAAVRAAGAAPAWSLPGLDKGAPQKIGALASGPDLGGNPALISQASLVFGAQQWRLVGITPASVLESPKQVIAASSGKDMKKLVSLAGGIVLIAVIGIVLTAGWFSNRMAKPLQVTVGVLEAVASGDYDQRLELEGNDEIGRMAHALNQAVKEMSRALSAVQEGGAREKRLTQELREKVDRLLAFVDAARAGDLTVETDICGDDAIGKVGSELAEFLRMLRNSIGAVAEDAKDLALAAGSLTAMSEEMQVKVQQTSGLASEVAHSVAIVNENMQSVAVAMDEMSSSSNEIARSASNAAEVGNAAVRKANQTNELFNRLEKSSREISEVVEVITKIAEQTNLLALNASIEAASAGAAGRGFNVVATEVKELAKQTAGATEDIRRKIEAIRKDTTRAVGAIAEITEITSQINELQSTIATAVEEQTATISEISHNVTEAAHGSAEIAGHVEEVAGSAMGLTSGAYGTSGEASKLAAMSKELTELVSQFKY